MWTFAGIAFADPVVVQVLLDHENFDFAEAHLLGEGKCRFDVRTLVEGAATAIEHQIRIPRNARQSLAQCFQTWRSRGGTGVLRFGDVITAVQGFKTDLDNHRSRVFFLHSGGQRSRLLNLSWSPRKNSGSRL